MTESLITKDVFDKVAPMIAAAMALVAINDQLGELTESTEAIQLDGWESVIRDRTVGVLRSLVADVRRELATLEAVLS